MHQEIFRDVVIDDYMRMMELTEDRCGDLYPVIRSIVAKSLNSAIEYADDYAGFDTDPLEYTDVGSSESELDGVFYDLSTE